MSLSQCPGCARHVRAGATECPFCDASVPRATKTITRHLVHGAGVLISAAALAGCFPQPQHPVYGAPAPSMSPSPSPSASAQP